MHFEPSDDDPRHNASEGLRLAAAARRVWGRKSFPVVGKQPTNTQTQVLLLLWVHSTQSLTAAEAGRLLGLSRGSVKEAVVALRLEGLLDVPDGDAEVRRNRPLPELNDIGQGRAQWVAELVMPRLVEEQRPIGHRLLLRPSRRPATLPLHQRRRGGHHGGAPARRE